MYKNNEQVKLSQSEREAFASVRTKGLSREEKRVLWGHIQYSMRKAEGSYLHRQKDMSVKFFSFFTHRSFAMSALSLVALLGSGFGIARASESALPGQALYPVKINVNEAFIGSLKRSDTARAEWEQERAGRRITEAETLAEEGKLGEEEKNEIEEHLFQNRKTFEALEGRTVTDEEFLPKNIRSTTRKINVRVEHTDEETFIHIEEKSETEEDEDREAENGFVDEQELHISDVEYEKDDDTEILLREELSSEKQDKKSESGQKTSSLQKTLTQQKVQGTSSRIETDGGERKENIDTEKEESSHEEDDEDVKESTEDTEVSEESDDEGQEE